MFCKLYSLFMAKLANYDNWSLDVILQILISASSIKYSQHYISVNIEIGLRYSHDLN